MKRKILFILLLITTLGFAQEKGTVTGVVTDKDMNNEPLPFAAVAIKGTNIGTNTDENGKFSFSVPAGSHTLVISFMGYETVEVPFTIASGETKTINRTLTSGSVTMEEVVIEKTISREKETALLLEQKNATVITQTIGAQEMSRKGVSDAEGAVTKVTGITKQQGERNVFVRGLGDRYNSTTMNGLPLPSDNPEFKNVSLDYFSSDIIRNISVNKTFSSQLYGDVGGANIDIITKELTGGENIELSVSAGANTQTLSQDFLLKDDTNFLGSAEKDYTVTDLNTYNFENSLNPQSQSTQINSAISLSGGKRFDFGNDALSIYLVGSHSGGYKYREGELRQTTSVGTVFQDQKFERYTYNAQQTVMGNFKYRTESKNTLAFNTLYLHSNTSTIGDFTGPNAPEQDGDLQFMRRQQTNNNNLFVNQLLSTLKVTDKLELDLGASYNMTRTSEPDRMMNVYVIRDGVYSPSFNSAGDNERYFANLDDNELAAKAIAAYSLSTQKISKVELGYNYRNTTRDFENTSFVHRFSGFTPTDPNNADATFNQASLDAGVFDLQTGRGTASNPRAFDPFTYNADRTIHAGLATFTHEFTPKFLVVVGARFDKINQEIEYDTNIAKSDINGKGIIDESYFLPNLNLKYSINDKHVLRAGGSMSYTLPAFIEIAPFKYRAESYSVQGNAFLVPSETYNADIKWEFYPQDDELIAITGFYKNIKNPIARSEIPSGGSVLTFLNTGGNAMVVGAEIEIKKNIYKIDADENGNQTVISGGFNASYLYSEQKLEDPLPQFTKYNQTDGLQGASPLLINADLTYRKDLQGFDITSSLVLNYFSDRIFSIGTRGYENIVETGIPTLDFITHTKLGEHFGISLKARNLLNPEFTLTRESNGSTNPETTLLSYRLGLDFSLGLSYKF
ncbi:MAG: TonB-dependent receptor domain-containing protein [Flavobacterium sp.]